MEVKTVGYKNNSVITVSGDIDMYSSPELRNVLMQHINKKVKFLFVDFREVTYMDSSGIATFVEGLKSMKTYDGRLKLFGLPEGIMEIFRFSKLDNIFEIYGNIEDALNS